MKRLFLPFMMLCLLFVGKAQAQEELTVCDGTSTNSYVPVYGLWMDDYTRSEMIYPAEMLDEMTNGEITSLTFYISQPATGPWTGNVYNCYLMEVDATTLSAYYTSANAEIVYTGGLDGQGSTMVIEFDTPFEYSGGNLLIGVEETVTGTWKSCYFYGESATGASAAGYSGSSLAAVAFNQQNFLPKVTFAYEAGDVSCPRPKNVVISDVTAHNATISWTAGGEETSWLVGWAPSDDIESYQAVPVTTTSYTMTGLIGETEYTVAVVAVCDMASQDISNPSTKIFTTPVSCEKPLNVAASGVGPHSADITWLAPGMSGGTDYTGGFYDFNADFDAGAIQYWTNIDADGDGNVWKINTSAELYGHDGENPGFVTSESYINYVGALTPDNYLVSPQIAITNDCKTFSFWACAQDSSWPSEHFGVAVSTTSNTSASDFTTIQEWDMTAKSGANMARKNVKHGVRGQNRDMGAWYQYTVDLSAYIGQNAYIAIRHFNCTDLFRLNVDEIAIGQPAEGPVVVDIPFNLRYREEGGQWVVVEDIVALNYALDGLNAETTYEVAVQTVCGGEDGESAWVSTTFTTDVACPAPTTLAAENVTTSSANITWSGYSEAYTLRYRPVTGGGLEEGFENGLPDGWTIIDNDGDGFNWYSHINTGTQNLTAHTGDGVVASESYNNDASLALTPDNWLITPLVALGGEASFWYIAQDADYADEHFRVYVSTSGLAVGNFQPVSDELVATGEYQQCVVDLSSYAGQTGYVAIRHFNVTDMFILNVDDFVVTADDAEEAEWIYVQVEDAEALLSGLAVETTYEVQVMGDCSSVNEGFSEWSQVFTFTTLPSCPAPTNVTVTNVTNHEATITWTAGGEEELWNVMVGGQVYEAETTTYTLTGLDPDTEYTVEVVAVCGADDASQPATATFTTDIACPVPTNVAVSNIGETTAVVTWDGIASEYVLCYRPVDPNDGANVTLTAGDIWGDGSGYQMLLDADATAFGTIIPETGALTSGGDVPASTYAEFEYKIPENADGSLATSNIVINNSVTVTVPGGTYDWCITNPTPGDRMWIAAANGNVGGRQDDYVFENGMNYEFTISTYGTNDGVDVTITAKSREFEWTCIDNITENTFTLEDLDEATQYEVKVQAVCGGDDGESAWTATTKFTTDPQGIEETEKGINVWNRAGEIRVDLANGGNYTMNVVNILGQTVMTSNVNGMGSHIVKHNLTAGVYVVTLSSADNTFSTKIVVR